MSASSVSVRAQHSFSSKLALAGRDIIDTLRHRELWWTLGIFDLRQRYRRSVIGPFWITISSALFIGMLSYLWSTLFGMTIATYMPFFAVGHILWSFFSSMILEISNGFIQFEGHIKLTALPTTSYLMRLFIRQVAVLLHNAVLIVAVFLVFPPPIIWSQIWLAIPGLVLMSLLGISLSGVLAMMCARFRDFPQMIQALVQIVFFATPIIWENRLPANKAWVVTFNPLHYFIEAVRAPLLGRALPDHTFLICTLITALSCALYLIFLARYRNRIVYWL